MFIKILKFFESLKTARVAHSFLQKSFQENEWEKSSKSCCFLILRNMSYLRKQIIWVMKSFFSVFPDSPSTFPDAYTKEAKKQIKNPTR